MYAGVHAQHVADGGNIAAAQAMTSTQQQHAATAVSDQMIRVPDGHVLEQVAPGVFALRPALAVPEPSAAAPPALLPPVQQQHDQQQPVFYPDTYQYQYHQQVQYLEQLQQQYPQQLQQPQQQYLQHQYLQQPQQYVQQPLQLQPQFIQEPQQYVQQLQQPAVNMPKSPPAPITEPPKKRAPSVLFRERQKGMITDLEKQVVSKLEELRLLSEENKVLKLKTSVLERAVEGWGEQIDIMNMGTMGEQNTSMPGTRASSSDTAASGGAQSANASTSGGAGGAAAAIASGDGTSSGASGVQLREPPADRDDPCWWQILISPDPVDYVQKLTLADTKQLWCEYVRLLSQPMLDLQQQQEAGGNSGGASGIASGVSETLPAVAAAAADAASPAAAFGAALAGGPNVAVAVSGDALAGEEHQFLFYARAKLPPGYVPGSPLARIYSLVNKYVGAIKHIHLLNPSAVDTLIGVNLQTGGAQSMACGFWRNVVEQLQFTPTQVEDLCAMHELFMHHVSGVLSERADLQARLGRTDCLVAEMEITRRISANITKELALRLLLHSFAYDRVFTPLQLARAAVHSFPLFPDVYAMVSLTAKAEAERAPPGTHRQPVFPPRKEPSHPPHERQQKKDPCSHPIMGLDQII